MPCELLLERQDPWDKMRGEEILDGDGERHGSPGDFVKHCTLGTTGGDSWQRDGRECRKNAILL